MPNLTVTRAKPNPAGRDRANGRSLPAQLLGEWVDITNTATTAISLGGSGLTHREYDAQGQLKQESTVYWQGSARQVLQPGQVLRVHTGRESDRAAMSYQDSVGAHYHAFAESYNFVLNNAQGDEPSIWAKDRNDRWSIRIDGAWYSPYPPEGIALRRMGDRLVP
ncbi:MAG: hypothetical protein H7A44_08120 [Opitutaceae bacterium]|nr:hypothetical protein [Cephaloticoccus sp.]MCP5530395.1 hypothetical protein [Opitutaceae bacterium]